jgi:hypothetical protein
VDDSRHGLLHWLHNYLAEQAESTIYRPHGGGIQFREDVLAAEEGEG